jgi:hypothetical protein
VIMKFKCCVLKLLYNQFFLTKFCCLFCIGRNTSNVI